MANVALHGQSQTWNGVDYSPESVSVAGKINREWIAAGRVEIREGLVSQLPFAPDVLDLVSADTSSN